MFLSQRLTILIFLGFCFLVNFELKVDKATMEQQVSMLRKIAARQVAMGKEAIQPRFTRETHSHGHNRSVMVDV